MHYFEWTAVGLHQVAIVYEHPQSCSSLCSPLPHYILPVLALFSPFPSSSCFPCGHKWGAVPVAGRFPGMPLLILCLLFHQWTGILHFCCVSKYLLAFLFLNTPTGVGCVSVHMCAYVSVYICVSVHTETIPPPPTILCPVWPLAQHK